MFKNVGSRPNVVYLAADAIGSLADVCRSALRSCAWKQSVDNILRRYAASILIVDYSPRVTAATRASPEANLQKALRAYLWLQSLSVLE